MIKQNGSFDVHNNRAEIEELLDFVDTLPDGKYDYIILDKYKNRALPQLKYLFGVVLKAISDGLPNHPQVDALYRWFEEVYAPIHVCNIEGQKFEYVDLKNETSVEMDNVIQKIIHHATSEWGIKIPDRDYMKTPEAKELYADAYLEMWKRVSLPNHTIASHEQHPR